MVLSFEAHALETTFTPTWAYYRHSSLLREGSHYTDDILSLCTGFENWRLVSPRKAGQNCKEVSGSPSSMDRHVPQALSGRVRLGHGDLPGTLLTLEGNASILLSLNPAKSNHSVDIRVGM